MEPMRYFWIIAAVLLAGSWPARAGIYSVSEKLVGPSPEADGVKAMPLSAFRVALSTCTDLRNPEKPDNKERDRYLERKGELERKRKAGDATLEDLIDLSYYLIGLAEYQQAVELLEGSVVRSERFRTEYGRNPLVFMAFANLGSAYQIMGQNDRAAAYLTQVKDYLPRAGKAPPPGWSKEQLEWAREAEKQQLRLLRTRASEINNAPGGKLKPPETVDDLFGVKFAGESGQYEAGQLAEAERKKLPPNALAIVQQLLLWLPAGDRQYDARLFWLLGEVYNAQGDVPAAHDCLDRCSWDRALNATELREHRQVLQEALPKAAAPPGWLPPPEKLYLVGGVTWMAIMVLLYFQMREFRRRRQVSRSR